MNLSYGMNLSYAWNTRTPSTLLHSVDSDSFLWNELVLPKLELKFTFGSRKSLYRSSPGRYMFKYRRKRSRSRSKNKKKNKKSGREMGNFGEVMHGLKPTLLMVLAQMAFAGVNVLVKLAVNNGMSLKVLIAYRFMLATAFVLPIALVVERKKRPKLTPMIVFQGFLCGLLGGTLNQFLYLKCLVFTSATFASAMGNLAPASTFILAVIFRMEKLELRSLQGKLKIIGTVLGISGAMILTFFKGANLDIWETHVDLMKMTARTGQSSSSTADHHSNHLLGAFLGGLSCVCYGLWLIIQTKMSESYPCQYSSTALLSLMASLQATVFALCTEKDWSQWKLGADIRLLTVVYTGMLVSGMMISVISWCVRMRGPVFVSVFNPLMLVLVAIASSLLLKERLSVGSLIGAVLIVAGLYMVVWGKGKELKRLNQLVPAATSKTSTEEGHPDRNSIELVINGQPTNNYNINNNNNNN